MYYILIVALISSPVFSQNVQLISDKNLLLYPVQKIRLFYQWLIFL